MGFVGLSDENAVRFAGVGAASGFNPSRMDGNERQQKIVMEIVTLPAGEMAPLDKDCVHIARTPEGKFGINCSALRSCGDGDEVESVALIGGDLYDTYETTEAAGLAWAADQCVEQLFISSSG